MIVDLLPANMGQVAPLTFAAPAIVPNAAGIFAFDVETRFRAAGGCLYLFDNYTFCSNITQEQFAGAVAINAPGVTDNAYVPGFSVRFAGIQGGTPESFPVIYPAAFGKNNIRAYGMSPSDEDFEIIARVFGRLAWDTVGFGAAPAYISLLYGLTVYQIKEKPTIDAYKAGKLGSIIWPAR